MKSTFNYFRISLFDSAFLEFTSLSGVTCFIEKSTNPLSYDGKLLQCFDDDEDLLFSLRISVSILFKSDSDDFTVYSINYSMFDI